MGLWARLQRVGSDVWRRFREDDVLGLAAELAFRWLLALFPLAIMTAAFAGFAAERVGVADPTQEILDAVGSQLPPEAAETLRPQLDRVLMSQDGGLLTVGLVLTVYAASAGMRAIIKGFNRAYRVDERRPFWRQVAVAVGLTVLMGTSVVASFIVLVVGQVAARDVAALVGLEEASSRVFELARFPLVLIALGAASAFLYWSAPAQHPRLRWTLPGVAVFVPGWMVATMLFSLYVDNFGSYDDTYGTLGGVIVLLLWLYLTFVILLLGAQLNAAFQREFDAVAGGEPSGDSA
ncbi:MAG: YihY/virulence factor BrkB family protein [Chloroflexota bacterium]|jgi:membrane protein